MNRKTLLAGAVFAGLLLITLFVLRRPEKGTRTGQSERPIAAIGEGKADTLEVTKDGKKTVIKREGSGFKVTEPVPYPADVDAAKQAFEAVEKLEFGSIVTDQKSRHDEYEVGVKSPRVIVKKGATVLADFRVGKMANNQTLIRKEGSDQVWQAVGSIKWQLDKDSAGFRDKSITTFDQNDAERLEVVSKTGGKIVLTKAGKSDAGAGNVADWKVVETTAKVEPFDKSVPGDLLSALYSFKANDFADGVNLTEAGLDAPALTVTVGLKGDKNQTLMIGNKKGEEDFYVKKADSPQVFLVKKYNLERINKRPIEFRDKTICNLASDNLTQVAVTRPSDPFTLVKDPKKTGDDAWKLAKPAGVTLDTSKVNNIVSGFKEWKASGFAEDGSPVATGLAKPTATVVASAKGGACNFKVGAETADKQSYYVAAAGAPDVFVAPKWSVDRVLVKLDDLKKK
jgi:Domain of unknown function (DUF4340)